MWGRKESSDVKVILPGEMGMINGGQIGTFAVGSGCRGYLAYDQESAMGGVAHVDFSDQDAVAVNDLVVNLYRMGARDVVIGATHNADLYSILDILGIACQSISLPTPEFVFDTSRRSVTSYMAMADKKCNFESRKNILKCRIHSGSHELLWV